MTGKEADVRIVSFVKSYTLVQAQELLKQPDKYEHTP